MFVRAACAALNSTPGAHRPVTKDGGPRTRLLLCNCCCKESKDWLASRRYEHDRASQLRNCTWKFYKRSKLGLRSQFGSRKHLFACISISRFSYLVLFYSEAKMLRLWRVSGEELGAIPMDVVKKLRNVRTLKRHLRKLYGFPACIQQLVREGSRMNDDATLEEPIDVQVVLLPASNASGVEEEFLEAAEEGHVEVVRMLLEAGADKDLEDIDSKTALIYASDKGHGQVVRLLLAAGARDLADGFGYTALFRASWGGHVEVVRLLLEAGANKDLTGDLGDTALSNASWFGHAGVVRMLLEFGANKDLTDSHGYSALIRASEKGHVETVRLLLEAGAATDARHKDGKTALIFASFNGHVEVSRLLLEAGADKTFADVRGYTALGYASAFGREELVRLLA